MTTTAATRSAGASHTAPGRLSAQTSEAHAAASGSVARARLPSASVQGSSAAISASSSAPSSSLIPPQSAYPNRIAGCAATNAAKARSGRESITPASTA